MTSMCWPEPLAAVHGAPALRGVTGSPHGLGEADRPQQDPVPKQDTLDSTPTAGPLLRTLLPVSPTPRWLSSSPPAGHRDMNPGRRGPSTLQASARAATSSHTPHQGAETWTREGTQEEAALLSQVCSHSSQLGEAVPQPLQLAPGDRMCRTRSAPQPRMCQPQPAGVRMCPE